ncbi:MAG: glycosyltransferase [Flavobacteriia bacterium]
MTLSPKYKEKLVVVLSRFPYPLEKGDKLRAYYQLKELSEVFEIHLFCTSESEINNLSHVQIATFCKEIHIYNLKKGIILLNIFKSLFTKIPFQVAYFSQNWIKKDIERKINIIQPNHIFCQLIRPAEYVKNIHSCPKTIDLMDALSKGMERRIEDSNWLLKQIFREEARRLRHYETKILDYFEHATIISNQDKSYIIHPKNQEIKVIPNGVGDKFTHFNKIPQKKYDLIFTGNMSYAPNVKACIFISQILYPKLIKVNPNYQIALVGATPSKSVLKCANKNISVTGWVDDIREKYAESKIFIAPLFSGSGLQNKILEAMAMGVPCITTSLVNNAILAQKEKEIIIADTADEMVDAIFRLNSDEDLYNEIARNAKEFVNNKYTWNESNKLLIEVLKSKN